MSIAVMAEVWKHSEACGNDLLLLLAMADHAHDDGLCWPSIAQLADKTRVSESTVKRSIKTLVDLGELKIEELGGTVGARRFANRYRVLRGRRVYRGEKPQESTGVQNEPGCTMNPALSAVATGVQNDPGVHSYDPRAGFTTMDPGRGSQLRTPNHHKEPSKRTVNNPPAAGVACAPEPKSQQVVVVSSLEGGSEEEPRCIEQLQAELTEAFGLEGHQIEMVQVYAEREGFRYIEEKATLTRLKAKENPARYFELAMKRNWPLPVRLAKKRKSAGHQPPPAPPDDPAPEPITPEQQQVIKSARRALLESLRNPSQSPEAQAKTSAAEARYERMKRRWDEASLEERNRWISQGDPIVHKYFRAEGPLPMRSLWSAIIPDADGEAEQPSQEAAA